MACKVCGVETEEGWDGHALDLCQSCKIEEFVKETENEAQRKKLEEASSGEIQNTFKFRTIIFLGLGFIVPLWIITLPLFWLLAYQSYKAGAPANEIPLSKVTQPSHLDELEKLKNLLDLDALTREEFDTEKAKVLSRNS